MALCVENIVVESIAHKLRWLARELRWINDPSGIEKWVASTMALGEVMQKMKDLAVTTSVWNAERRNDQTISTQRVAYTISPPCVTTLEYRPTTERLGKDQLIAESRGLAAKRGREWERRENWTDMIKNTGFEMQTGVAQVQEVQLDGDDLEMWEPNPAVVEEVYKPQEKTGSDSLEWVEDVNEMEQDAEEQVPPPDLKEEIAVDETNDVEKATGEERRRGDSAAKEKIKLWWKEALWRKLKEKEQEQEYWAASENFTRLLCSTGNDKELSKNLTEMFPRETGNSFLVISKENLRVYLNKEMNNFYLLKTWSK